jgi:hypothetical protein
MKFKNALVDPAEAGSDARLPATAGELQAADAPLLIAIPAGPIAPAMAATRARRLTLFRARARRLFNDHAHADRRAP